MPKDEVWYKKISGILGVVVISAGIISGIFTIDNRYAKCQNVEELKQDTSKTLQQVRVDMQQDRVNDRYDRLRDRKRDLEYQLRKNPNDKDLKNDLEEVKAEMAITRQNVERIDKIQRGYYSSQQRPMPAAVR